MAEQKIEQCPSCKSTHIHYWRMFNNCRTCNNCGHEWTDEPEPFETCCLFHDDCAVKKFGFNCRGSQCQIFQWDGKTMPLYEKYFTKSQLRLMKNKIEENNNGE